MQALRFYFADMLTDYEAARLMVYRAAAAMDKGDPQAPMYCAMAKRMATDIAFNISDKAMQLHGETGTGLGARAHGAPAHRFRSGGCVIRDLRCVSCVRAQNSES